MAAKDSDGKAADPRQELWEDLAAFAPVSGKSLKFQGQTYPVRAFLDLSIEDALRLLRAETFPGDMLADRLAALGLQIALLVPAMPEKTRQRLSLRQAIQVAAAAKDHSGAPAPGARVRIGFWFASVWRFYGGTWESIPKMTLRQISRFLDLIPELQARESLDLSLVSAYPYMGKQARRNVHTAWLRTAGLAPVDFLSTNRVKWQDVRAFIGAPDRGAKGGS